MKKSLVFTLMSIVALVGYSNKNYAQNCVLQLDNSNNVVIQNNSSSQPYFVLYTLNGAQKTTVINPSTTFQLGTAIPTFTNAGVKSSMAYPTNASILNQLPSAAYNASDATLSALYISPATSPSTKYSVSPAFSPSTTSYTVTIPKTTGPFYVFAQPTQATSVQMLGSINNSAFTAMGVTVTASMTTLPIGSWYFIENGTTSGTISVKLSSPDKSSTETYTINYTVQ